MNPHAKSQFDNAAQVLGLDMETRDRVWRQIADLGMNPDDPTTLFLALSGKLDIAANAFADLPAKVEAAAKRAVGPVGEKAGEIAKARVAEQFVKTEALHQKALGDFSDRSKALMADLGKRLGEVTEKRFANVERREIIKTAWQTASGLFAAVALVLALVAFGAYQIGHSAGRTEGVGLASGFAALASRSDAPLILNYANHNDFNVAQNAWCGTGSNALLVTVEGARRCGWLWYDQPPVVGERSASILGFWNSLNGSMRWIEPVWLILVGAAFVGTISWFRHRRHPYS